LAKFHVSLVCLFLLLFTDALPDKVYNIKSSKSAPVTERNRSVDNRVKTGNESLVVGLLSCLKRAREMTSHLFRHRKQPAERHAKHFMLLRGAKNQISLKYR